MATTTTTNISDVRQLDERELRAWRGMLRAHAALTKALDADLDSAHGLPLSSYEVLLYLNDADDRRMRMRDLASSVILSRSGPHARWPIASSARGSSAVSQPSDARGAYASSPRPAPRCSPPPARRTSPASARSSCSTSPMTSSTPWRRLDRVVPGSASGRARPAGRGRGLHRSGVVHEQRLGIGAVPSADARGPDERLGRLPSRELDADAAGEQDADRGRNLGLGA